MSLDSLTVRKPCHADWSAMTGDERKKLCGLCNKHVHNLSEMRRKEAEALVAEPGEKCVRFRRAPDGRIATRPSRWMRFATAALTTLVAAPAMAGGHAVNPTTNSWTEKVLDLLGMGAETDGEEWGEVMGEMAIAVEPRTITNGTEVDIQATCEGVTQTIPAGESRTWTIEYGSSCTINQPGEPGGRPIFNDATCTRVGNALSCGQPEVTKPQVQHGKGVIPEVR